MSQIPGARTLKKMIKKFTSLLVQETPVEELGGIAPSEPHEEIAVGL